MVSMYSAASKGACAWTESGCLRQYDGVCGPDRCDYMSGAPGIAGTSRHNDRVINSCGTPKNKARALFYLEARLAIVCLLTLGMWALLEGPARADTLTANIIVNVSTLNICSLVTDGLVYNFSDLAIGQGKTLTGGYTVECSGTTGVKMDTLWDGKLLRGKTYTFPDNGDTVDVQFCNSGSATSCRDESNSVFNITKTALDLRLTYTAKSAEKDKVRNGVLQLSYN